MYFFKKEEARETNPHLGHSAETAGQQNRDPAKAVRRSDVTAVSQGQQEEHGQQDMHLQGTEAKLHHQTPWTLPGEPKAKAFTQDDLRRTIPE